VLPPATDAHTVPSQQAASSALHGSPAAAQPAPGPSSETQIGAAGGPAQTPAQQSSSAAHGAPAGVQVS
jgi:hypothetical protein